MVGGWLSAVGVGSGGWGMGLGGDRTKFHGLLTQLTETDDTRLASGIYAYDTCRTVSAYHTDMSRHKHK